MSTNYCNSRHSSLYDSITEYKERRRCQLAVMISN